MGNANLPAQPQPIAVTPAGDVAITSEYCYESGLTKREYACIHLCVPETGDPELDAIITKARNTKIAAMAMQGLCAADCDVPLPPDLVAMLSIEYADALLAELEKLNAV